MSTATASSVNTQRSTKMPTVASPAVGHSKPDAAAIDLILRKVEELPTLSTVATRLMSLSGETDAEYEQIITLLESDPALCGRMLTMCRRASLGLVAPVTTVRRAVALLGLEAVQAAALSVQIYEVLGQSALSSESRGEGADTDAGSGQGQSNAEDAAGDQPIFDRTGFWRHCIATAACSEMLASKAKQLKIRPDEAFTCGLIHDIGKLVLDWILPLTYRNVLAHAEARSVSIDHVERQLIGIDHHAVGRKVAEHWGLPLLLQDVIWLHGSAPEAIPELPHRDLIILVSLANILVRRMHLGWSGSCDAAPPIAMLQSALGMSDELIAEVQLALPSAVAIRCADIGLDGADPDARATAPHGGRNTAGERAETLLLVQSISNANTRLSKLTLAAVRRGEQVHRLRQTVDAVATFCQSQRSGVTSSGAGDSAAQLGGIAAAASGILSCYRQVAGAGVAFVVFQARPQEQPDATTAAQGAWLLAGETAAWIEPPAGPGGSFVQLAEIAGGGPSALGATVGLLTWLAEHAPACPDLRTLRISRLCAPPIAEGSSPCQASTLAGPSAVLVYAHGMAEPPAALCDVWAMALTAAARYEGAKRVGSALADAGRTLANSQAELAETQSLARLREMTAGAAHELNNPLTVISGRAQMLASKFAVGSPLGTGKLNEHAAAMADDAKAIVAAAAQLTTLISRLHELGGKMLLKPVVLTVKDIAASACKLATERYAERAPGATVPPIRISVGRADRAVFADKTALVGAIAEVLCNAMQSEPKSGLGMVAQWDPAAGVVRLQVIDDGRGMSERAVLHAFDPFFSDLPAGRRPGLGLTMARRTMLALGGTVRLRSRLGDGTTVTFELPPMGEQVLAKRSAQRASELEIQPEVFAADRANSVGASSQPVPRHAA